ncbi:DUF6232 family protein [Fulvivirga ligni]|uniref:DUF6232 family protein n=1 Tax=Fulvivirga ligni TaxID=2904246 RepID=UPI001F1F5102|nr:DUF6232 family protein [Fulvivirga ligni]UII21115.1 DUF6232 family protein [Fulvivirga ligni]
MKREEIIYTDGHGVKITRDKFYTEKKEYNLEGITNINLQRLPASKAPGIILFVLGFLGILLGSLELFADWTMNTDGALYVFDTNMLSIGMGVVLIFGGIIWMIAAKDKYAVEIRTAEGDKRPIISKSREYVAHITGALKKAYYRYVKKEKVETVIIS